MSIYVIGVDPGSTGDRTGVSIVRRERTGCHLQTATAMRGIKMSEIAQAILALVRRLDSSLPASDRLAVVIDRGGIGLGPAEEIERELKIAKKDGSLSRRVVFRAVHVVGGDGITPDPKDSARVSVGRDLLYERGMQAVRERTLVLANAEGDAVKILHEEMDGLIVQYSGARRTARTDHAKGKNDDVVFSMLLAFWLANQVGFGAFTNAAASLRDMRRALVGRAAALDAERTPARAERKSQPKPQARRAPDYRTAWTHADLMQVVRRESLGIRGPHNMHPADLFNAVNAALRAAGKAALPGAAAATNRPAEAFDASWSRRLF